MGPSNTVDIRLGRFGHIPPPRRGQGVAVCMGNPHILLAAFPSLSLPLLVCPNPFFCIRLSVVHINYTFLSKKKKKKFVEISLIYQLLS